MEHNTIQVSWSLFDDITRRLGGTVVYFTVYAIPFASEPSSLSTFSGDMLQTLSKVIYFFGNINSSYLKCL